MPVVHVLCGLRDETCLPTDLRGDFIVRETGGGEDGDLLTTRDRVHGVDCGDAGGDHFFGVHLDVELAFSCGHGSKRERAGALVSMG